MGAAAVVTQLAALSRTPKFNLFNFLSLFTIPSTLFAAGVLFAVASRALKRKKASADLDKLRGAAVLYLVAEGVVFSLLLYKLSVELESPLFWFDVVVHYVMPVVLVVDWWVKPPRAEISGQTVWRWLWFPMAFFGVVLVRGAIVDWYPYAFLNPSIAGYPAVIAHAAGVAVGLTMLAWVVADVGNRRRQHHVRSESAGV